MNRRALIQVILTVACVIGASGLSATAAHADEPHALWSGGTAYLTPPGRLEVNLLTPSRVALSDQSELFMNIPLLALTPNLGYKRAHTLERSPLVISSRYRANIPSLLRGFSSIERQPFLVTLDADLLVSARLTERASILTFAIGTGWTPRFGRSIGFVDQPSLLAPRVGNVPWAARARVRWDAVLVGELYYFLDTQLHVLPEAEFAQIEQRLELSWRRRRVRVGVGVMAIGSVNKTGARSMSALPTIDAGVALD